MSMEEIEKLRVRVEKDPNSRFFLPLAEEYRKSGMLDEAISVILRGLQHQPGYTSARVALGRLYLEKDMLNEARAEFENVVTTIPDNLFSHKKLSEIYKSAGETDKAVQECKKVLELNPLDEDAKLCLEELEGRSEKVEELLPTAEEVEEILPSAAEPEATAAAPLDIKEDIEEAAVVEPVETADQEFEDFRASFSGKSEEAALPAEETAPAQPKEEEEAEVFELAEEAGLEEALIAESAEAEPAAETFESLDLSEEAPQAETDEIPAADSFISSGNYYKAMEIYKKVLSADPQNKHVLQRVVELRALLKLLGKGEEMLIARLEAFLGAVKRNFDRDR